MAVREINAGLSRLSSQMFSGFSPIVKTECHYWTHSLLGTGTANLALFEIFTFIRAKLGTFRIPQRLKKVKPADNLLNLISINPGDEFWHEDHLGKAELAKEDLDKIVLPLITYYSGRDGFKSTLNTLSAPLAAVSSCNSRRWTLMTLTHEVSHIFVNGCLKSIYPKISSQSELERIMKIVANSPRDWPDEITRYMIYTIITMEKNYSGRHGEDFGIDELQRIFNDWFHYVEEVMAHIFDFLYFYQGNVDNYIRSIWLSWSVIPNISNRIPEYVERSLCAILSLHLRRRGLAEKIAIEQLRKTFISLDKKDSNLPYIHSALDYLNHWTEVIKGRLVARKGLVAIVRAFLFSETARAKLFEEHKLKGDKSQTDGYDKVMGHFDSKLIDNPLRFLDIYTRDRAASPSDSLWLLSAITFNAGRIE